MDLKIVLIGVVLEKDKKSRYFDSFGGQLDFCF